MKPTRQLGRLQIGIIVLTLTTAIIHLALVLPSLFSGSPDAFTFLFIGNFLGYVGLVAGLYYVAPLVPYRTYVRLALMAFTGVTLVGYFVANGFDIGGIALVDKIVEVLLLALLGVEQTRAG